MSNWGGRCGWVAVLAISLAFGPERTRAADPLAPSLAWVPADAAFYSASLRLGEQFDALLASQAAARVRALPAVQRLIAEGRNQIEDPDSPAFFAWQMMQLPENQRLLALANDLVRDEIVVFGDSAWGDALSLVQEVSNRSNFLPLMYLASGRMDELETGFEQQRAMPRMVFELLRQRGDAVRVPELTLAFHVGDPAVAVEQLERLKVLINIARASTDEEIPGELAPATAGDFSGLSWKISGDQIPFGEIPWEEFEDSPGEFDDVVNHLMSLDLVVALGTWRDYVVVSLGGSLDHLAELGQGDALANREEWSKLADLDGESVCSVGYVSGEFLAAANGQEKTFDILSEIGDEVAKNPYLTEEEKARIQSDVDELVQDMAPYLPKFGPAVSAQHFAPGGYRGLSYSWSNSPYFSQHGRLTLLDHIGDSPWIVGVGRGTQHPEQNQLAAKWYGKLRDYAYDVLEKFAEEDDEPAQILAMLRDLEPHAARIGAIFAEQLQPSLADGQVGFVLDGKLRSREPWMGASLPVEVILPEPALLLGVSNAEQLVAGCSALRQEFNAAWQTIVEHAPPGEVAPDFEIPAPQARTEAGSQYFYYPIPPGMLDPQIMPNAGVGESIAALTISFDHSQRLIETGSAPTTVLDFSAPAVAAFRLDMEAIWRDLGPLVDFGVAALAVGVESEADGLDELGVGPLQPQIAELVAVAQGFRGVEIVTRIEGDVLVSESFVSVSDVPTSNP